jgi:hypothetical protein
MAGRLGCSLRGPHGGGENGGEALAIDADGQHQVADIGRLVDLKSYRERVT